MQTLKVHSGRTILEFFSLNFVEPSYNTGKGRNWKGVQFVAGEHWGIFRSVAHIYKVAKVVHGIVGLALVILAEDETTIKS